MTACESRMRRRCAARPHPLEKSIAEIERGPLAAWEEAGLCSDARKLAAKEKVTLRDRSVKGSGLRPGERD